jgi:hypothetical protein
VVARSMIAEPLLVVIVGAFLFAAYLAIFELPRL